MTNRTDFGLDRAGTEFVKATAEYVAQVRSNTGQGSPSTFLKDLLSVVSVVLSLGSLTVAVLAYHRAGTTVTDSEIKSAEENVKTICDAKTQTQSGKPLDGDLRSQVERAANQLQITLTRNRRILRDNEDVCVIQALDAMTMLPDERKILLTLPDMQPSDGFAPDQTFILATTGFNQFVALGKSEDPDVAAKLSLMLDALAAPLPTPSFYSPLSPVQKAELSLDRATIVLRHSGLTKVQIDTVRGDLYDADAQLKLLPNAAQDPQVAKLRALQTTIQSELDKRTPRVKSQTQAPGNDKQAKP